MSKIVNPAVERKKVVEKFLNKSFLKKSENQRLKELKNLKISGYKSKKVAENFNNSCKQNFAEKSWNQRLKVKKFWKILKPAVESKNVAENLKISGRKLKSCWKIFKPAVESKKVAEISENGCK